MYVGIYMCGVVVVYYCVYDVPYNILGECMILGASMSDVAWPASPQ